MGGSIQRAILGLSKDKAMIGSNIVVPLPEWDRPVSAGEDGRMTGLPKASSSGKSAINPNSAGKHSVRNSNLGDTLQLSNTFENLEIPKNELSPFDTGTPPDQNPLNIP